MLCTETEQRLGAKVDVFEVGMICVDEKSLYTSISRGASQLEIYLLHKQTTRSVIFKHQKPLESISYINECISERPSPLTGKSALQFLSRASKFIA